MIIRANSIRKFLLGGFFFPGKIEGGLFYLFFLFVSGKNLASCLYGVFYRFDFTFLIAI